MSLPNHADPALNNLGAESMHPGIPRSFSLNDPIAARSLVGLAELPTIVATGPFDDPSHADELADAFTLVRKRCTAQLVLLGTGRHRTAVVRRAFARGVGADVHLIGAIPASGWSDTVAAADVVVPGAASEPVQLLEVLAIGRPVVAPVEPANVRLVLPTSAGLLYRPGDGSQLAAALLRLLTSSRLRHGMACRAAEVARRHPLTMRLQRPARANGYA